MLKVTRTQERDRGLYSCMASNEAGVARRNFSVEVLGMSQPHSHGQPTNPFPPTWELPGVRPGAKGWGCGRGPSPERRERPRLVFFATSAISALRPPWAFPEIARTNPKRKGTNMFTTTQ